MLQWEPKREYPGFAWLMRRVLDMMVEFFGLLYNWLQQFTNHWHTVTFFDLTLAVHYFTVIRCTPLYFFDSDLNYDWPKSDLWLAAFCSEFPVLYIAYQYSRKRSLRFQKSISTGTYMSFRSLAMGLHVTIFIDRCLRSYRGIGRRMNRETVPSGLNIWTSWMPSRLSELYTLQSLMQICLQLLLNIK
jgi:hypothetical protein